MSTPILDLARLLSTAGGVAKAPCNRQDPGFELVQLRAVGQSGRSRRRPDGSATPGAWRAVCDCGQPNSLNSPSSVCSHLHISSTNFPASLILLAERSARSLLAMPPTLDPARVPQHREQTWAPAGRARAGTHNAVLYGSDIATEESDAGPMRSRSQRRSTVGADFHRASASQSGHEGYGYYTAAPLPPHMYQHPPHPSYQHQHVHAYAHAHPYYPPDPDSRRSSGQASMIRQGTPISTPSAAPSSQGSRSTTPSRVSHLALSRPTEEAPDAPPQAAPLSAPKSAPLVLPGTSGQTSSSSKEDFTSMPPAKSSSSKTTSASNATTGKGLDKPSDRRRRRKIPFSYSSLIAQAISSSHEGKMTLREIYAWINWAYPDLYSFDGPDAQGWQNTVRHNLSLNKMFVKVPRSAVGTRLSDRPGGWGSVTFPRGKGGYWMLDSSVAGAPIALPGPQRGVSAATFSAHGLPNAALPHFAQVSVPAIQPAGQAVTHPSSRGELDTRFQHSVSLYERPRPYPPPPSVSYAPLSPGPYPPHSSEPCPPPSSDPQGILHHVGAPSGNPSHSTVLGGGTRGRRRAVTYNASAQSESDYAYAYAYGAPCGTVSTQIGDGVEDRRRARGYTTTAAEVIRDFNPMTHTDFQPGSDTRPTNGLRAPEEHETQPNSPNPERRGDRAKGLPARMSISGMLND